MTHGGDIYRNEVNIDFSVNLNPMGTPPEVTAAMEKAIEKRELYPDLNQEALKKSMEETFGADPETLIFGSGASELLMAIVRAINPKTALIFEPSFTGYTHALEAVGCNIKRVILKEAEGFMLSKEHLAPMDSRPDIVFVCNPVNPTGFNVAPDVLEAILEKAKEKGTKVVLDESFYLLSQRAEVVPEDEDIDYLVKYDNLYILRSFTKILAIPGIRAGYLMSNPRNIEAVKKQLPEWNISVVSEEAIRAGIKVLKEGNYVKESVELIKEERDFLQRGLMNLGFIIFKSNTCFIMFKGPEGLYDALLKRGILIRDCSDYPGLFKGFYRIAVKKHEDNVRLIETLKEIIYEL